MRHVGWSAQRDFWRGTERCIAAEVPRSAQRGATGTSAAMIRDDGIDDDIR